VASNVLSRRRVWVDGFSLSRVHVTNRDYLGFLDDLVAQGREADALRHAPRERGGTVGEQGSLIYGYEGGRFSLRPDADGDVWLPDCPVTMVDWLGAAAFAAWQAARTGQAWRLPHELEWEKGARGVDGRFFPWGDGFDPSWCCIRASHQGRRLPAEVGRYPVDESVYGARDLAGNMRDCTAHRAPHGLPVVTGTSRMTVAAASAFVFRGRSLEPGAAVRHSKAMPVSARLGALSQPYQDSKIANRAINQPRSYRPDAPAVPFKIRWVTITQSARCQTFQNSPCCPR
jgi:formylglycine-generating enzyme required for sulfatase activity